MMPSINVDAIFIPTQELDADTAYLFAGRKETLLKAAKSLSKPQSSVAIFGDRGVGKSSLGRILMGLLDGRIPVENLGFPADLVLPRRSCIRIAWKLGTQSLEHMLYRLFDANSEDEQSFAKQFPNIADKYRKIFEEISLRELTVETAKPSVKLKPNQVLVHNMVSIIEGAFFADTKQETANSRDGLVIVIDEMDQAKNRGEIAGLGSLIKNTRFQFIAIGIGAAVTDILEDHLSAERQFFGGQFLVEPLTKNDVRELFMKASEQAREQGVKLSFSDRFCDLVAEDFAGYPAQIQAFGLDIAMNYQQRLEAGGDVRIRHTEYVSLLQLRETSTNRDLLAMNSIDAGVDGSVVRWELLKAIAEIRSKENVRWITRDRLRLTVSTKYLVRLSQNLKSLVESAVLEANDTAATIVNIASPAVFCEIKRRIRQGWDPKSRLFNKDHTS